MEHPVECNRRRKSGDDLVVGRNCLTSDDVGTSYKEPNGGELFP